jgi:hypothetical protein
MSFTHLLKVYCDIAPLLVIQGRLRKANIKLNASCVSNANKASRKNEAVEPVVQILSTLILPSAPPADGDMSKLTPDNLIKKED